MALGVTPLRVGQEDYWLEQIARNRHQYYSAQGELPGWWVGSLAENAGLGAVATDEAIHRLFAGKDSATGEQRVTAVWRADPRSKLDAAPLLAALRSLAASRGVELADLEDGHERLRRQLEALPRSRKVNAATAERLCRAVLGRDIRELYGDTYDQAVKHAGKRIDARVAAFDLSFSDVKSVSLLAAGGSADVRRQVQAARHAAIREVLAYLEREAVGVRRGHNGTERHKGLGFTGAAFDHRTSREGDPQWHTHVLTLLANSSGCGGCSVCRPLVDLLGVHDRAAVGFPRPRPQDGVRGVHAAAAVATARGGDRDRGAGRVCRA